MFENTDGTENHHFVIYEPCLHLFLLVRADLPPPKELYDGNGPHKPIGIGLKCIGGKDKARGMETYVGQGR